MCSFVHKKGIFIRQYDALKNSNLLRFLSIDPSLSESLSLSFSLWNVFTEPSGMNFHFYELITAVLFPWAVCWTNVGEETKGVKAGGRPPRSLDVILPRLDSFRLDTPVVCFIVHRVHFASFLYIGISFTSRYYSEIKENLVYFSNSWKSSTRYMGHYIGARLSSTCILSPSHKSAMRAILIYEQDVKMIYLLNICQTYRVLD